MAEDGSGDTDIAIVGLACRFPGASDVDEFWRNLCDGVESIRSFTHDELDSLGVPRELSRRPDFVAAGAPLADADRFDNEFWGYSPREAAMLDPQQRLFLETAWHAVEHAGYDPRALPGLVGSYAGMGLSTYLLFNLAGSGAVTGADEQLAMLGNDKDFLTTRVAYHLDLRGPSMAVQTGCSTSLTAVHLACDGLLSYQCDMALAGGASVVLPDRTGYVHFPGSTASSDGHCRAFDAKGDGTVFAGGVGAVVLKRLADALADGDTVHAVIKGSAMNNDGANRVGFTAPGVDGQAEVIARAQDVAGVAPSTVSYVEAHGTATELGDPVEIAALTKAFRRDTEATGFCAIGSVKTNVGHLDAAAGVASLIKTTLALREATVPPSLNFTEPNPRAELDGSPFYVAAERAEWPRGDTPRRAGVSAFGFGGTNVHLVLEEHAPAPRPPVAAGPQVLVLSARTPDALDEATDRLTECLRAGVPAPAGLADVAATLQSGRSTFAHRRALVCGATHDAGTVTADAAEALASRAAGRVRQGHADGERDVAFLLSGLGDQYAGMGADLYRAGSEFAAAVDECADLLRPLLGLDIRTVLYPEGTEEAPERPASVDLRAMLAGPATGSPLHRTALAHPALFVVEYALARQWRAWGVRPSAMIGHSLGEYVAATLAGVFRLPDALALIVRRARLIDALPEGAMLAVPRAAAELEPMLSGTLAVALINGTDLTVVGGSPDDIAGLERTLADAGDDTRRLAATHPFHTPLLVGVRESLAEWLRDVPLAPPEIPFVSNTTGTWITPEQATDPGYWAAHSASPVDFAGGLATLCERPYALVEIGPGQSLCSLAVEYLAGLDAGVPGPIVPSLRAEYDHRADDVSYLLDALAQVWTAGGEVDWAGVRGRTGWRRVPLPGYPFERTRHWIDPSPAAGATTARCRETGGWFHEPVWRTETAPPGRDWSPGGRWLLLADPDAPVGPALADRLRELGQTVILVRPGAGFGRDGDVFTVDPLSPDDFRALRSALSADGGLPGDVVHLWTHGVDDAETARAHGLHALLALGAGFLDGEAGEHGEPAGVRVWAVTDRLFAVHGDDRPVAAKSLLLGAMRCLPQECAGVETFCVDLPATGSAVGPLLDVLAAPPADRIVACRGRRRWVQDLEQVELPEPVPLAPGEVHVIVGGTGCIGLDLAEYLAEPAEATEPADSGATVVLIARHALDGEKARRVAGLTARGADVRVLQADVTDLPAMREAFAHIRATCGHVTAVVHAAGVAGPAAFQPIADASWRDTEDILRAKTRGTDVLAEVLADGDRPDCVLLLSSNAAILGGLGTAAYSAGNVYLDTVAEQRHLEHGDRWVSVNLEQWLTGAADAPTTSFTQYGVPAADGVRTLRRIMTGARGPRVALFTADLWERFDRWVRDPGAARRVRTAAGTRLPRPPLATPHNPPADDIERAVARLWQDLLGIDGLGRDDNFYELGGHSLLATQIVTRARAEFGVELSLLSLLASPTIAGFAERVRGGTEAASYAPIPAADRDRPLPLSYAQRGLWFLDRLAPDNAFYNVPHVVRVDGVLRVDWLRDSVNDIVARHEVLRTGFVAVDGEPVQRVQPALEVDLPVTDLRALPEGEREQRWRELATTEAATPFDLSTPPLVRVRALRVADETHVLLLTMHHSVSDAWSIGVFLGELSRGYATRVAAHDPEGSTAVGVSPVPAPAIQYADYAQWQREYLHGRRLDELLGYWRAQLDGAPPLVEFPLERTRPRARSFRGATTPVTVPAELVERLRKVGSRADCTLFMTLLAAFDCLLHRHSGGTDLVVGSPIAGRERAELEDLVGVFVNMLPLRVRVDARDTFAGLLAKVRETTLGAYDHQDLPFEMLVEALHPDRGLSHAPIFQNVFVLQNAPLPPLELAGLRMESVPLPATHAKFDLMLTLRETPEGAVGEVEYATDLFEPATIERLVTHFLAVLEQVAADPDVPLGSLELLSPRERDQLAAWSTAPGLPATEADRTGTTVDATDGAAGGTLPELLSAAAQRRGRDVAVSDVDTVDGGGESFTFAELEARSNQLADHLRRYGIGAESRVGVCADRSARTVVLLLAIMKAGAAYVPLDPAYPADRLAFMLAEADVDFLVHQAEYADTVADCAAPTSTVGDLFDAASSCSPEPLGHRVRRDDPAYVLFTSGSTGTPKGVVGLHGGMLNRLHWMWRAFPFAEGEVCCQKTSLNFLDSFWEIFGPLARGVPIVVVPHEHLLDPVRLAAVLAEHGVTRIVLVPSLLRLLLDSVPDAGERLPALRLWVCSGEALPAELARRFHERLPGRTLLNLYGSSEVSADVTWHVVTERDAADGVVPLGRPLAGVTVHVLDDRLRPVPPGVVGEVFVGGEALARGYLGSPGLTARRFVPDPFTPGARLFRTGDLARRRGDGVLEYVGRRDHQVKVRGFRVELAEVEAALAAAPGVAQAVAAVEGDALVAYVTAETPDGNELDDTTIQDHLRRRLPDYMLPSTLVHCATLPLTPSGKIDRTALAALPRSTPGPVRVPPRDDAERAVAGLWADVLSLDGEVGVTDDFFAAGGYSLLATRFVTRVRESFGAELALATFFADPTVAGVVAALRADPVRGAETDRVAAVLLKVAAMSDEEVRDVMAGTRMRAGERP